MLERWQKTTNLVAPDTLPTVWTRHVADSAQLVALAPPDARTWVDLGAGGGFPGLVVAAILEGRTACHLVESNGKKAAFLREAARTMGLAVAVHPVRAEHSPIDRADVVSARALAPLSTLLDLAGPLLKSGAIGLFPKGREAAAELTVAEKSWRFAASLHPSRTESDARVICVERFDGPRDD